jgi:hypothetical protein
LPPRAHAQLVLERGDLASKLEVYEIEYIRMIEDGIICGQAEVLPVIC